MIKNQNKIEYKEHLVNYVDHNLPPVRSGVEMIPISHESNEMIYFHDPEGYLEKPFVLKKEIASLIPMLNGNFSIKDIQQELKRYGSDVEESELLSFIRQLDEARLLLSPWFHDYKEKIEHKFEESAIRPPVCAGQSYPTDPSALNKMLYHAFTSNGNASDIKQAIPDPGNNEQLPGVNPGSDSNNMDKKESKGKVKALFAPHIDPRIGLSSYIPAFRSLSELRPSRVVMLATSHYSGMFHPLYNGKPFVATRKNFETPLGIVETDQQTLDELEQLASDCGCSFHDRAHRNEHSIELHLIFLQYLWSHPFKLVPLLVGSLEEMYYQKTGDIGKKVEVMASFLREKFGDDEDTLFLISGDLAHVGRKFGDRRAASELFDEVNVFDQSFLEGAKKGSNSALLELISESYDPYRICGFPPLYTALTALPGLNGTVTSYELWDEREQESAVTFGSVLYRKKI